MININVSTSNIFGFKTDAFVIGVFEKTEKFIGYLLKKGVNVSLRRSRGKDINAACGQLANKN